MHVKVSLQVDWEFFLHGKMASNPEALGPVVKARGIRLGH